ncbi:hypothetical protein GCM10011581_25570 [Saccharopolyspora subtropica]|uniref:Uncharacterized protein n=1 Tax=Saccharopolyspora thermophila TaxID=89367 RepID=A0A917JWJ2_9PSEU|nr:hypothetical protein GCM10011581_25570 [Saccharopolyspora subtropica]
MGEPRGPAETGISEPGAHRPPRDFLPPTGGGATRQEENAGSLASSRPNDSIADFPRRHQKHTGTASRTSGQHRHATGWPWPTARSGSQIHPLERTHHGGDPPAANPTQLTAGRFQSTGNTLLMNNLY